MDANSMAILTLLGGFSLMVLLCLPITYTVALSPVFCLLFQGHDLITICQQMVRGVSSFDLTAIPFFITMGCLMGSGGISEKLIAPASAYVDWVRGGVAMVNTAVSYFFGGIPGSASAGTASLGSILIPMMADQGYDDGFLIAITVTLSCEGLLVPPSYNMVIYATIASGTFVGNFLLAGYALGALLIVALMIGSYIISVKRNYPKGERFSIINLVKQLSISFRALAVVLIVVLGVVDGVSAATEPAAVAVIYSLIVSVFIYKGLDWKGVQRVLGDSADTLFIIMVLIATSNIFGSCLTRLHVPILAASVITGVTNNSTLLVLLPNLILLILGCIMDMASIILIATSALFSAATPIGLGPVQFGIMVVPNCGIGLLTPPASTVLFIGSAVSRVLVERVVKTTLPFYVYMITTLPLITLIPAASMWLPSTLAH